MSTKKQLILLLSIGVFFLSFTQKDKQYSAADIKTLWQQVQGFEKNELPKSALKTVDVIYEVAKNEQLYNEMIKALIHHIKYKNHIEPNALPLQINFLKKQLTYFNPSGKAIINSMLAEMHFNFYRKSQWKILDRTNVDTETNGGIETWDYQMFMKTINSYYNASLKSTQVLQQTPVKNYLNIIEPGTASEERPTLFDFLLNRALKYYKNSSLHLTVADANFTLNEKEAFADAGTFVKINFTNKGIGYPMAKILQLYQQWLTFRLLDKKHTKALFYADLLRLNYVFDNSARTDKDEQYLLALNRMLNNYELPQLKAEIKLKLATYYKSRAGYFKHNIPKSYIYKNYTKKAHDYCNDVLSLKANKHVTNRAKRMIVHIETKKLNFEAEDVVPPKGTIPVLVSYKNVDMVYLKIHKINIASSKVQRHINDRNLVYRNLLAKAQLIKQQKIELPKTDNYLMYSTELLLDALPVGLYIISISADSAFNSEKAIVAYSIIHSSNIAYVKRQGQMGEAAYFIANRISGVPLKGIKAQIVYKHFDYRTRSQLVENGETLFSDNNGKVIINSNIEKSNRGFVLELTHNGDTLETGNAYTRKPTEKKTQTKVHLFTDRVIYRPGQTVYFKGLVIQKTGSELPVIATNHKTKVLFKDVHWKQVAELELTTNKYGTFSGLFTIPTATLNGKMVLHTPYGTKYIHVEEYKRPTFEVLLNKPTAQVKIDKEVSVNGKAIAYNGMPLQGAKVKYIVKRMPQYIWWRMPSQKAVQIGYGTVKSDKNGKFTIIFKALSGNANVKPDDSFTFTVEVDITNTAGETHSAATTINIGGNALNIDVLMGKTVDKQNPENWVILLTNSQGNTATGKVDITISKLKANNSPLLTRKFKTPDTLLYNQSEYLSKFKGFFYSNSDYYKNLKNEPGFAYSTSKNIDGEIKFLPKGIEKWSAGLYKMKLTTTDNFKQTNEKYAYFTLYDPKSKKIPYPAINWFVERKQTLEPGSIAEAIIGTSEDITVLYQVEHNKKIVHSENVIIKKRIKKFTWLVTEGLRGGFAMHFTFIYKNRLYYNYQAIDVPFTNKQLQINYQTFRDKLKPGEPEQWTIKLKGAQGEKVAAEMLAGMYDASLDQFKFNNWSFDIYPNYQYSVLWRSGSYTTGRSTNIYPYADKLPRITNKTYSCLNWFNAFGYQPGLASGRRQNMSSISKGIDNQEMPVSETANEEADTYSVADNEQDDAKTGQPDTPDKQNAENKKQNKVILRKNFNETAFFYPNVYTDSAGVVTLKFTMPESLTKWKFQALAHTQNLEYVITNKTIVTQKELMAEVFAPRFVTQNDTLFLPVKIQNLTNTLMSGKVTLTLQNPLTEVSYQALINDKLTQKFKVEGGKTVIKTWKIIIADTVNALQYKVVAKSGNFSDGEQKWIPVLSNRVLVTETQPLWVNGTETRSFLFKALIHSAKSTTIKQHRLTLEFTANPTWYAVKALPYLVEKESKCAEQVFTALYANTLSEWIVQQNPKLKSVFNSWRNDKSESSFLSNLEKNSELKQTILNETPWLLDALDEKEQKQRIAVLFDVNQMASRKRQSIYNLQQMQYSSGAWPWFNGMGESRYVTQYITTGIGKLKHLGALKQRDYETSQMVKKALRYLDKKIKDDYNKYLSSKDGNGSFEPTLSPIYAQYLYMRSFFKEVGINADARPAVAFYAGLAKKQWQKAGKYSQGMLALYFYRSGEKQVANAILKSLKEYAMHNNEQGMYWKENILGYYWYQSPIEFQSLMIEVFTELEDDKDNENELKKWLLKNKQANNWKTTKATADAIYAILYSGSDWVTKSPEYEIVLGNEVISSKSKMGKTEEGTGYLKKSWGSNFVYPDMGNISITRKGEGISWGAVYWQYFENVDKIKPAKSGLVVSKTLYKEVFTKNGNVLNPINNNTVLEVGDRVVVRLDFSTDRRMEYVHLKDNSAAAFEPLNVFSGYKYQGGVGYYQSTHDTSTDFFIEYLPVGNYTVEYRLNVTHSGSFSSGIATLQCMYAPEFAAHSKGGVLFVR